jgi:hypothetical protein
MIVAGICAAAGGVLVAIAGDDAKKKVLRRFAG